MEELLQYISFEVACNALLSAAPGDIAVLGNSGPGSHTLEALIALVQQGQTQPDDIDIERRGATTTDAAELAGEHITYASEMAAISLVSTASEKGGNDC